MMLDVLISLMLTMPAVVSIILVIAMIAVITVVMLTHRWLVRMRWLSWL